MATANQIKSLISSHYLDEKERFYSVALQIAAHEAKLGHLDVANEIRSIVSNDREKKESVFISLSPELIGLVLIQEFDVPLTAMVISSQLRNRIKRIIHEYKQQDRLKSYGLKHRRKILLIGPPGTGKTFTSKILSKELNLSLYTIQLDQLITKFMGETSAKLRLIFDLINQERGIYLFDEFDAIGGKRSMDNDVGEMRRVLNTFLQFIEQDNSDSLIIAATNNPNLLDMALYRRFDDLLVYTLPDLNDRKKLISNILGTFLDNNFNWNLILSGSEGLSHAEIDFACKNSIKESILNDLESVSDSSLLNSLLERKLDNIDT